jgi:putative ATPase
LPAKLIFSALGLLNYNQYIRSELKIMQVPLAERMRPSTLDNYIGQTHIVGEQGSLKKAIDSGYLPSIILWGPPGVGKTTLANILAKNLKRNMYTLSAINAGVKDVREIIDTARKNKMFNPQPPILFIDEIHRFSKSQQDSLLGAVEKGVVTLIGATTENPSFEVISALLSRCQVYVLKHLEKDELVNLLNDAMKNDEYLSKRSIKIEEHEALLRLSGGDARKLLNTFELVVNAINADEVIVTNEKVMSIVQENIAMYDKNGEQHYDIISAFIKSMRGNDPNAAIYYLARMLKAGEDPKFIARRMLILASEDIGNANPTALVMANNCFQALSVIGMPEGRIILAQTVTYLASSPKSNASYLAIDNALALVDKTGDLPVPLHLRNAPTSLMKEIGYGDNYKYVHHYAAGDIEAAQEFFPDALAHTKFYEPGNTARENDLRSYLRFVWKDKYGY